MMSSHHFADAKGNKFGCTIPSRFHCDSLSSCEEPGSSKKPRLNRVKIPNILTFSLRFRRHFANLTYYKSCIKPLAQGLFISSKFEGWGGGSLFDLVNHSATRKN